VLRLIGSDSVLSYVGVWRFFHIQRPTQFRQGDILELTDSFSRNPKLLAHFFEGLRFPTI
jgi:hypothetical protein